MKLFIENKGDICGTVNISGSKNSAVAIIPAATLTNEKVTLYNIPNISDVTALIKILNHQGYKTKFCDNTLTIKRKFFIRKKFTKYIDLLRGSYYFIGCFLSKFKKIKFGKQGGCDLGSRPIDYHFAAFQETGAIIKRKNNYFSIKRKKDLNSDINLNFPSVGATINIMLASVIGNKKTNIYNASIEPEVIDLGNFLIAMGAKIIGLGTEAITIIGVKKLNGCNYTIISDRIEAATFLALGAAVSDKGVTVNNINVNHLKNVLFYFKKMGCTIHQNQKSITIYKPLKFQNVSIITGPYPAFPTDLNPIFCACLLSTENSKITEKVYENRNSHVSQLQKLGANLTQIDNQTFIKKSYLRSSTICAYDLRCAASLIIAALQIDDSITIENIDYLLRGYEDPVAKLKSLNINAKIID